MWACERAWDREDHVDLFDCYSTFPIRKTLVPHFEQVPFTAGRPFFSVVFWGSFISLLDLHFTQYASTILKILKLGGI